MARRSPAWCLLGVVCTLACSTKHADSNRAAGAASASALARASASAPPVVAAPHVAQPKPACRALAVTGEPRVDADPISVGTLLDGEHWVALAAGSSVSLRHTLTSREFKLIGPARILPCRGGSEQLLVAHGQLSTSANLGVRPGAEVLIATPGGVVHYGDAALDVEFGPKGLRVRVKQGEAWLEPEERGKPRFKNPLHSGVEARLAPSPVDVHALVLACQVSAEAARESARQVLTGGAGAAPDSLGARAASHMRDRGRARTACAIAAAAAGATADPAEKQSLSASVVHSDEVWQSVPRAVPGQKN